MRPRASRSPAGRAVRALAATVFALLLVALSPGTAFADDSILCARLGVGFGCDNDDDSPGGGDIMREPGGVEGLVNNVGQWATEAAGKAVFDQIADWVGSGAQWTTQGVIDQLEPAEANPPLDDPTVAPKHEAFVRQYELMKYIGLLILMPLTLISIIQAVLKGSSTHLVRTVTIYVPVAIIGSALVIKFVEILIGMDDEFSSIIGANFRGDAITFLGGLNNTLHNEAGHGNIGYMAVATFAYIFLLVIGLALWIELLIRDATIHIATLFMPIAFAALVWPVWSRWFRRFSELLVMLVFSKFLILSVVSLGAALMAGNVDDPGNPSDNPGERPMLLVGPDARLLNSGQDLSGTSFESPEILAVGEAKLATLLIGGGIFLVAAATPFTVLRMLPLAEAAIASGFQDWRRGLRTQNSFPTLNWNKVVFADFISGYRLGKVFSGEFPVAQESPSHASSRPKAVTSRGGKGGK